MEALLFFQTTSKNLLLGFMPDTLGLLIFGIGLIALAVILRWILSRKETIKSKKFTANIHSTVK